MHSYVLGTAKVVSLMASLLNLLCLKNKSIVLLSEFDLYMYRSP